ncbi:hypothetical protein ACA910_017547 [Epithemia clementina (nom. ined.)]
MSGIQFPEEGSAQQAGSSPMSNSVVVEMVDEDNNEGFDKDSLLALTEDAGGRTDGPGEDEEEEDERHAGRVGDIQEQEQG